VKRAVAIGLKIPDNEALTALTALRRFGVPITRLERASVLVFTGVENVKERVTGDETLFNSNKHVLEVLERSAPRAGETWIEELEPSQRPPDYRRYTAWRLFSGDRTPADAGTVRAAVPRLLCNPAIERAIV